VRILIRFSAACFLLILGAIAVVLHFFEWPAVESFLSAIPYRCPLKLFTGLDCAFCGMTHSWIAILRGEWSEALRFNVLGPFVWVLAVGSALAVVAGVKIETKIKPWMGAVSLTVLIGYFVIRNLLRI
jgi:hypothetical protein